MGNHYHAIVTCTGDPAKVSDFFGYVNGEISSLFHRLTGVSHDNFWACRFKSQPLLTSQTVIEKIAYLYLNPVKAYLIDEVVHWEGFITWKQFIDEKPRFYRWANDSHVERLPRSGFSRPLIQRLCDEFEENSRAEREFKLQPYAWKNFFPDTRGATDEELKAKIIKAVEEGEKAYRAKRIAEKKKVCGVTVLRLQNIYQEYKTRDYRKTPVALSSCLETLREYKKIYNDFCAQCEAAWEAWKNGNFSIQFPPAAFIPRRHPMASSWG